MEKAGERSPAFFFCALICAMVSAGGRMPQVVSPVSDVAHLIQLAVAPVFLLSAVAAFLGVLTSRLGRIIDRARRLEERLAAATPGEAEALHDMLRTLSRRAKLVSAAITLCTAC